MGRKPKSIKSYINNTVWPVFSKYIRLRDCIKTTKTTTHCQCITCKRIVGYDQLDAGHWQSRRHHSTLFNEKNVHAQCKMCNKWRSGEQSDMERALVDLYGKKVVDEIWYTAHNVLKKFTIDELKEIKQKYEAKIEELT